MLLKCNIEVQEFENYKFIVENNLHSSVLGEYSLIENISGDRWLFSYKNASGDIKHHPIRSFCLGKNRVYKNGGMIMASSLEALINVLTKGLIQIQGVHKKAA